MDEEYNLTSDLRQILHRLTTAHERSHPAVILGVGILPVLISGLAIELWFLPLLQSWLWRPPYPSFISKSAAVLLELLRLALGVALLAPLHVVFTRLVLQRTPEPPQVEHPTVPVVPEGEEEGQSTDITGDEEDSTPSEPALEDSDPSDPGTSMEDTRHAATIFSFFSD